MRCVKILYVDDEPDIREVAELCLQLDPSLMVRTCESGKQAIEVAASWQPDAIVRRETAHLSVGEALIYFSKSARENGSHSAKAFQPHHQRTSVVTKARAANTLAMMAKCSGKRQIRMNKAMVSVPSVMPPR